MRRTFMMVAMVAAAMGCGDDGEDQGEPLDDWEATWCDQDFEATVHAGPNTGLALVGHLQLTFDEEMASLGGTFIADATASDPSTAIEVDGSVANGQVTLRFHLADGRIIQGSGPISADALACKPGMEFEGNLTGPDAGDTGDWRTITVQFGAGGIRVLVDGVTLSTTGLLYYYTCFAACSYSGYSDAVCSDGCK